MSAPTVIQTATLTFGTDTYKVKKIPSDEPLTAEPVDVTCCDDTRKKFVAGALVTKDDVSVTIAAATPPTENAVASLTITLGSSTVQVGNSVVKSVTPSTIGTANTEREITWDVVFTPCGTDPVSSQS